MKTQPGGACTICDKPLVWIYIGGNPVKGCPLHSTRGVPKDG